MADSLGTFGVVEDEEQLENLDLDPIPFTLVGYEVKRTNAKGEPDPKGTHARREFTFRVRPTAGFGPLFNVLHHANDRGEIPEQVAVQFLNDALVAEDQDRFTKTLRDAAVEFDAALLGELAEALAERYGMRPTQPRSARRAGPRRTGKTSTAGRSGRASTSRASKPRTRST